MFFWTCVIIYQYNKTKVMHFSFSLLRIKGLYIFLAFRVHPQESLHKQHLVNCVLMSVSLQPCHSQLTYARNTSIPNAVCVAPLKDEQVMLETCRGLWFSINWTKSASRWFHYTDLTVCHSVCPSAWNNSDPNERIFIKFDISVFFETVDKTQVLLKSGYNNG
jgi:hypothetical protein